MGGVPVAAPPQPPMPQTALRPAVEAAKPILIMKHDEPMLPEPQPAPPVEEFDDALPAPVSLAADDVARTHHEKKLEPPQQSTVPLVNLATLTEEASVPEQAPVASGPVAPPASGVRQDNATAPAATAEGAAEDDGAAGPRRRRRRSGRVHEKPVEMVASQEEAEHNQPSAADVEIAPLTGKLILPSADKPTAAMVAPKAEKPMKLAPGEVFVDENGNVMIGE